MVECELRSEHNYRGDLSMYEEPMLGGRDSLLIIQRPLFPAGAKTTTPNSDATRPGEFALGPPIYLQSTFTEQSLLSIR